MRPIVLDAGQLSAAGADDVDGAEGPPGKDEAMVVAGGVDVDAGNLPGVVDAEAGRAGGERKVYRGEHAGLEQKAVRPVASDQTPTMSPAELIPAAAVPVDPGKLIGVKTPPVLRNPCSTLAASMASPTICPGIVDVNHLCAGSSREIHVAEGAGILREAVHSPRKIRVHPGDQPCGVDARRDACSRVRHDENLVRPVLERERRRGRRAAGGIDDERAHSRGAVVVKKERLRRARIVRACERVDLRDSQPSGYGALDSDRRAIGPDAWAKVSRPRRMARPGRCGSGALALSMSIPLALDGMASAVDRRASGSRVRW